MRSNIMYIIKKSLSSVVVLTTFLLTTSAFAMDLDLEKHEPNRKSSNYNLAIQENQNTQQSGTISANESALEHHLPVDIQNYISLFAAMVEIHPSKLKLVFEK